MSFEENIKQWVLLDNQLKVLNEKTREIREKRSSVNENIQSIVQKNNLLNKSVQISDGNLKFVNTRVPAPLTYKYLETSLGEIIKNETQVKQIINYLKEKREIKLVSEIKRF
jgi:vacuolar-type H+-ATPase subunit H